MYQARSTAVCDGCHTRLLGWFGAPWSLPRHRPTALASPSIECYSLRPAGLAEPTAPKDLGMSLVKKNRIDHFRKNKKNNKKRVKEYAEQLRRITADKKAFAAKKAAAK